jgi:hypothetical protein
MRIRSLAMTFTIPLREARPKLWKWDFLPIFIFWRGDAEMRHSRFESTDIQFSMDNWDWRRWKEGCCCDCEQRTAVDIPASLDMSTVYGYGLVYGMGTVDRARDEMIRSTKEANVKSLRRGSLIFMYLSCPFLFICTKFHSGRLGTECLELNFISVIHFYSFSFSGLTIGGIRWEGQK